MTLATDGALFPVLKIPIRCPNQFILKKGCKGFEIEPNSLAKNLTEADCKHFGVKRWKYKRDRYGNKIPKWDDYWQPMTSQAYCIEHVYDPLNWVCKYQCRGKCLEGQGLRAYQSVKRLK